MTQLTRIPNYLTASKQCRTSKSARPKLTRLSIVSAQKGRLAKCQSLSRCHSELTFRSNPPADPKIDVSQNRIQTTGNSCVGRTDQVKNSKSNSDASNPPDWDAQKLEINIGTGFGTEIKKRTLFVLLPSKV